MNKIKNKLMLLNARSIAASCPKYIKSIICHYDTIHICAHKNYILQLLYYLNKNTCLQLKILGDMVGVDYPGKKTRFRVIYNLLSVHFNCRIFITVYTKELDSIHSAVAVYRSAEWLEREVWDLFGIPFHNHPDLRRILTDYGFKGHPLRKDFPLSGYIEVFYDDTKKRIIYAPVSFAQEYRIFTFRNPWLPKNLKKKVLK